MEFFYREMRRRYAILMDDDKPAGGAWNLDKQNRKAMPKRLTPPAHRFVAPNAATKSAIADVARLFPDNFGSLDGFGYATTPAEAETIVADFIEHILPGFGDYQDAMVAGEPWMWHSIISAAMNLGLDRSARCLPARRERVSRRPRAAQRRRGLHPPDPRLAGVHARHLLAEDAGLQGAQRAEGRPQAAVVVLVGRDRDGLACARRCRRPPRTPTPTTSSA